MSVRKIYYTVYLAKCILALKNKNDIYWRTKKTSNGKNTNNLFAVLIYGNSQWFVVAARRVINWTVYSKINHFYCKTNCVLWIVNCNCELVIIKQKRTILDHEVKIKVNRTKLFHLPSIKYLGVKIDENLNWHHHINDLAVKLNRANACLN